MEEETLLLGPRSADNDASPRPHPNYRAVKRGWILKPDGQDEAVYKRRWYIIGLFALLLITCSIVRNTWGPLAQSVHLAFGWTTSDLALLNMIAPLTLILSTPFITWLLDVRGLRVTSLLVGVLLLVGTAIQCVASTLPDLTWLIFVVQVLNGVCAPFVSGAAPFVSAVWFPVEERTTATAIGTMTSVLGVAGSFIIGPLLVSVPDISKWYHSDCVRNSSEENPSITCFQAYNAECAGDQNCVNVTRDAKQLLVTRGEIMFLTYIECGLALLVLVALIIYFPAKPPKPPSHSAHVPRVVYAANIKMLLRHKHFWLLAIAFAMTSGFYTAWGGMLDVLLNPLGVTQQEAGWVGFFGVISGVLSAVVVARLADLYIHHTKPIIVGLYALASVAVLIFALLYINVIPMNTPLLYAITICVGVCIVGTTPIYLELACDVAYPITEAVTAGFLVLFLQLVNLVSLIPLLKPDMGTVWMPWALLVCLVLGIVILVSVKVKYSRSELDFDAQDNKAKFLANNNMKYEDITL